ncbi:MAG: ATP-dependent helicase [Lachnospiraceae bacterium]|nr:ATP-dependent helicase [Lachnospiraceae bacterium]
MDYIRSKDLIAGLECSRKYKLQRLSLKDHNARNLCFSEAIRRMTECIAEGKEKSVILNELRVYLEEAYQEDWFPLCWQRKRAISRELGFFERFLGNFQLPSSSKISAGTKVSLNLPLCHGEIDAAGISGTADLLVEQPDGSITGVILCRNFCKPYSYRARKLQHKVENSLEMLVLMEGLGRKYPQRDIRVMMVRLASSADKPDQLAEFEKKKGDNIIQISSGEYMEGHPEGVPEHIQQIIGLTEECSCEDCFYENVCKPPNIVFARQEEEAQAKKKEISFSKEQEKVINHAEGPLRVCAGPGSGKTAVLVGRIRKLVESGVPAEKILAITFTKKAAQEMQERVQAGQDVNIYTLHALAFGILTQYEFLIGPVRLAGLVDCKNLLMKVLNHAPLISGVSYEGLTMRYGLIATLLKDFEFINKHGIEAYSSAYSKKDMEGIMKVKELYDAAFKEMGYITFDDQVSMAVELLKNNPGILETVQNQYDYIMVDEVQDLDDAQAEFVRLLVKKPANNVMICGDADQSIYAFRGGSNRFMLDFPSLFSGTEDILLSRNYRSSEEIVAMASSLIEKNKERVPMQLAASFSTGIQAIHIPNFNDCRFGALIKEIHGKGYAYSDIAVIARTNKELNNLCKIVDKDAALTGVAVPLERPKLYLREDCVFQMLLDLLELAVKGMSQDRALYRLLSTMGCSVEKTDRKLSIYEDHVTEGLIYDFYGGESSRYFLEAQDPLIKAYGRIYRALQVLKKPLKQALWELEPFFFSTGLCTTEILEKIEDIMYEKKIGHYRQLYDIMSAMKVFEDDTRIYYSSGERSQVHMLTAHDAKGKEFPAVILYGIDNFECGDVEEDRRLLYVAVTRAKRVLFILEEYPGKSNFLKDIGKYVSVNRRARYEK